MTEDENQILVKKYKGLPICKMTDFEVEAHTKGLLLKIYTITGWVVPEDDLLTVLIDQFEKHLRESYSALNVEEIEFAFRQHGTHVKDWGKGMNLSLIDSVLVVYLNRRSELSRIEESHKLARLDFKPREDTSDEAMRKWSEELRGQKMPVLFLPVMLYEWLVEKGEIHLSKKQKIELMQQAIAYQLHKLSQACSDQLTIENRKALADFQAMKDRGVFEDREAEHLRNLAKKISLHQYLYS